MPPRLLKFSCFRHNLSRNVRCFARLRCVVTLATHSRLLTTRQNGTPVEVELISYEIHVFIDINCLHFAGWGVILLANLRPALPQQGFASFDAIPMRGKQLLDRYSSFRADNPLLFTEFFNCFFQNWKFECTNGCHIYYIIMYVIFYIFCFRLRLWLIFIV
jgi:hypothetical protein